MADPLTPDAPAISDAAPQYDLPPVIPAHDNAVTARVNGYDWNSINAHIDNSTQAALASGYQPQEVDQFLGYQGSTALQDRMTAQAQVAIADNEGKDHPVTVITRGLAQPPGSTDVANPLPLSMAQEYSQALMNGEVKNPGDYAKAHTDATANLISQFTEGLPGTHTADLASNLASQLPTPENVTDAAIAAVHASGHDVTPAMVALAKQNVLDRWAYGHVDPMQSAKDAREYPDIADSLTRPTPLQIPPSLDDLEKPQRDAITPGNLMVPLPGVGFVGSIAQALLSNPEQIPAVGHELASVPGQLSTLAGHIATAWEQGQGVGDIYKFVREDPAVNFLAPLLFGAKAGIEEGIAKFGPEARRLNTAMPGEPTTAPMDAEAAKADAIKVAQTIMEHHADQAVSDHLVEQTVGERTAPAEAEAAPQGLTLYHGTPHTFDTAGEGAPFGEFKSEAIGSGEGNQAFGHGLYFAENEGIARHYRRVLSSGADTGNLYQVHVNAEPDHFLDWDKPLSEQSPYIQRALKDYIRLGGKTEGSAMRQGENPWVVAAKAPATETGGQLYRRLIGSEGDAAAASKELREAGVKGIRYLDEKSRKPALDIDTVQKSIDLQNVLLDMEQVVTKAHKNNPQLLPAFVRAQEEKLATMQAARDRNQATLNDLKASTNITRNHVVFDPKDIQITARSGETVQEYLERAKAAVGPQGTLDAITNTLSRLASNESGSVKQFWVSAARQAQIDLNRASRRQVQNDIRMGQGNLAGDAALVRRRLSEYMAGVEHLMPEHEQMIKDIQSTGGNIHAALYDPITGVTHPLDPLSQLVNYVETRSQGSVNPFAADHPLHGLADTIRDIYQGVRGQIEGHPDFDGMSFVEDYLMHNWKDANEAARTYGVGRQGSSASTNARSVPTYLDGLSRGLTPRFPNPIEGLLHYVNAMLGYKNSLEVMSKGRAAGYVKWGGSDMLSPVDENWERLKGRASTKQYVDENGQARTTYAWAPKGYARSYNAWTGTGFYGITGAKDIYTRLQYASNMTTALKLSLSGFHAVNIAQEAGTAAIARGLGNLAHGELLRGMTNIGMGALVLPELVRGVIRGRQFDRGYFGEAGASAQDIHLGQLWKDAGGVPGGRGAVYRAGARDNFWQAWQEGSLVRGLKEDMLQPWKIVAQGMDTLNAPLFDGLIPHVKKAAWSGEMADFIRRNPNADRNTVLNRAREVMDSMDDRFGEMNQDNLFWNRTLKQTLNLATVSIGWEYGTLRAFGGGIKDIASGKLDSTRARWMVAFPVMNAIMNNAYSYMMRQPFTWNQSQPLINTFMAPQTGGETKNGSEVAILPGYQKEEINVFQRALRTPDFWGVIQQLGGYAASKLNPFWQAIYNLASDSEEPDRSKSMRIKLEAAQGAPPSWWQTLWHVVHNATSPISTSQEFKPGTAVPQWQRFLGARPGGAALTNPTAAVETEKYFHDKELKEDQRALGIGGGSTRAAGGERSEGDRASEGGNSETRSGEFTEHEQERLSRGQAVYRHNGDSETEYRYGTNGQLITIERGRIPAARRAELAKEREARRIAPTARAEAVQTGVPDHAPVTPLEEQEPTGGQQGGPEAPDTTVFRGTGNGVGRSYVPRSRRAQRRRR